MNKKEKKKKRKEKKRKEKKRKEKKRKEKKRKEKKRKEKKRLENVKLSPSYNHMEKPDFSYFEVEDPNGINLIMSRDSTVTFSAKIRTNLSCNFE